MSSGLFSSVLPVCMWFLSEMKQAEKKKPAADSNHLSSECVVVHVVVCV